jgi:probable HAF family extracellular repeat protein
METSPGRFEAFAWTPGVGLRPLGTLGGRSSYGFAINANGIVVGNAQLSNGHVHAFYTDGAGTLLDLGTLGSGKSNSNSYAYGVNGFGDVVGYSDTGHATQAFLWTGGVMENLNALVTPGGGWRLDAAYGINDKGQIVGTGTYHGQDRGFLLDPITPPEVTGVPEPASFWLLLTAGVVGAMSAVRRYR